MRETQHQAVRDPESVWTYPTIPRVEKCVREIEIVACGITIAWSVRSQRVIERGYPPVYYVPVGDIRAEFLIPTHKRARCKWKGVCRYYHLLMNDRAVDYSAWTYEQPGTGFELIRDHFAFFAQLMDGCYVDAERVASRPADFYGGWITNSISGPFLGEST